MTQNNFYFFFIISILLNFLTGNLNAQEIPSNKYNLRFNALAKSWDEGIPLGNGMLGSLVWQNGQRLRLSLDRADLWDLRPTENLDKPEWNFTWVQDQWKKNNYQKVQKLFDVPYDRDPGPSKIPAAAIEFNIEALGEIESVELSLNNALSIVKWKNGAILETFINAGTTIGWFRFTGIEKEILPELITPAYNLEGETGEQSPVTGQDLRRLGYPKGKINKTDNSVTYQQEGWGRFKYRVNVRWLKTDKGLEGCWSINSEFPGWEKQIEAQEQTSEAMKYGFSNQFKKHQEIWKDFWAQSDISIPDSLLNKQWYLEMYKLKAASGNCAPPISLQAVWTADNGKLPPWKGDFHNDLNTQLSYWPAYSSNHLDEEINFINWLERNKEEFQNYTKSFYQTSGINVPGVATLTGKPMGGWIQYSFSPTVSAWLAHHYYLHWRYSMDRNFLEKEAYPWIIGVANHLNELSVEDENGLKKLPLSSSPEIFDNSRKAWFNIITNYDLALVRWTFEKAAELANVLGKSDEANKWKEILTQWPDYEIDPVLGFNFAKGFSYKESHRHFSHLMAFHPLGMVDWSNGEKDQKVIQNTIANLDKVGPDWWCGYSYSWLGNLKARAMDGKGAAEALTTFANCFCLQNSFHVNGDQSGTNKSKFTYRPFTLEGNFAFASGLQEMLIQSHTGVVHIFPAIPEEWKEISFNKLRTEGAFLVSAQMFKGEVVEIDFFSEKGSELRLRNPFKNEQFKCSTAYKIEKGVIFIKTEPEQKIKLNN
jgi:alpha-L-fucosidase 2